MIREDVTTVEQLLRLRDLLGTEGSEDVETPVAPTPRPDWHSAPTACKAEPDLWFAEGGPELAEARDACAVCPFRAQCVEDALHLRPTHGLWGGLDIGQLAELREERGMDARAPQAPKCGHPLEQMRREPSGKRKCRACEAAASRRRTEARRLERERSGAAA